MRKIKLREAEKFDTVKDCIERSIEKHSKNNAFMIKHKENNEIKYENITYKRLGKEIKELGTGLIDLGLENRKIAIIGKNSYEWVLSYISIITGVGVAVPLDKGLQKDEIIMSVKRSKAEAIIFDEKLIDIIEEIKNNNDTNVKEFISMQKINNYISIDEVIEKGKELLLDGNKAYDNHKTNPDELCTLIFTSGTTSLSKAVILTNKNIATNIYQLMCTETIYDTDVNLAFLPLHHAFGSTGIILFLANGATNVFCDGLRHIQNNLKEYKVTTFVCVPLLLEAMYKKINNEIEKKGKAKAVIIAKALSKLLLIFNIDIRRKLFKDIINNLGGHIRFIVSGASAIDKKVAKGFNDFGILTVQGYGLTETAPVLTAENEKNIKYGTVGLPMPEIEIKIEDKNNEGIGEIVAKGPNIMKGYYEMPEETDKVLQDGWFHTGDLGYIDRQGYVHITGRKKNVIVLKNGKNIYPEELEQLIGNLPYVLENMVFGKEKDDDLVVSVKVVYDKDYILSQNKQITEDEIKEYIWQDIKKINKGLPKYKYIKNLIVTDIPMIKTTTAKIKRFEEAKNIK